MSHAEDDYLGRKSILVHISPKLHRFLQQRRHADRLTIRHIVKTGIVAYILGDLVITQDGYYVRQVSSDEDPTVVIKHPDGNTETLTIEDTEIIREVKRQGFEKPIKLAGAKRGWGTRDLANHLTKITGRIVSTDALRQFLSRHDFDKRGGREWRWSGEDDPQVTEIIDRLERFPLWGMTERQRRHQGISMTEFQAAAKKAADHRQQRIARGRRDAEERADPASNE